jgi:hypothetical protein
MLQLITEQALNNTRLEIRTAMERQESIVQESLRYITNKLTMKQYIQHQKLNGLKFYTRQDLMKITKNEKILSAADKFNVANEEKKKLHLRLDLILDLLNKIAA